MLYFHGIEFLHGKPKRYAYSYAVIKALKEVADDFPEDQGRLSQRLIAQKERLALFFKQTGPKLENDLKDEQLFFDLLSFIERRWTEKKALQSIFSLLAELESIDCPEVWHKIKQFFGQEKQVFYQASFLDSFSNPFLVELLELCKLAFLEKLAEYPPANTKLVFAKNAFPKQKWIELSPRAQDSMIEWLPEKQIAHLSYLKADLWTLWTVDQGDFSRSSSRPASSAENTTGTLPDRAKGSYYPTNASYQQPTEALNTEMDVDYGQTTPASGEESERGGLLSAFLAQDAGFHDRALSISAAPSGPSVSSAKPSTTPTKTNTATTKLSCTQAFLIAHNSKNLEVEVRIGYKDPKAKQLELFPLRNFEFFESFQKDLLKKHGSLGVLYFFAILQQLAEQPKKSLLFFDVQEHLRRIAPPAKAKKSGASKKANVKTDPLETTLDIFDELGKLAIQYLGSVKDDKKQLPRLIKSGCLFEVLGKVHKNEVLEKLEIYQDPFLFETHHLGAPYRLMEESFFQQNWGKTASPLLFLYSFIVSHWLYHFPKKNGELSTTLEQLISHALPKVNTTKSGLYRAQQTILHFLRVMKDLHYIEEYQIPPSLSNQASLEVLIYASSKTQQALHKYFAPSPSRINA